MRVLIFTFLLISIVLTPYFVFAGHEGGFVPCGDHVDSQGKVTNPCTTCHFMGLANNIIDFLFKMIVLPLAALGILASGIVLLTAGGSESRISMGKTMLWNILIGFFIAVSAWAIINTVLGSIVKQEFHYLTESFPACPEN